MPSHPPAPLAHPKLIDRAERVLRPLARYHRHEVRGIEHLPATGPALVAIHHSFATYDGILLAVALYEATGRMLTGLGDDLIFKTPWRRGRARRAGIVPASHENAHRLLANGHLVGVAPGGMREALRPSHERYRVRWDRRRGFVRLAIAARVPIVLACCPAADRLYHVYLAEPILPPPAAGSADRTAQVDALHAQVVARMNALMASAREA